MDECLPVMNTGLRGVAVASSKICDVRGKQGKLIYRGFLIEDLAQNATFEEVCFLLLYERLPKRAELEDFQQSLKQKRNIPENIFSFLKILPADTNPMDVLQMATPLLVQNDITVGKPGIENTLYSAENLISGLAIITAAWDRIRNKQEIIPPDNNLSHAANFLYMLKGEIPDDETARFFDTSLVLHAEHSFNASTFTARQVASTKAHIYAAISAAIGSLSGSLHGGANVRVMEMLKQIGSVDKIDGYIQNILNSGGLIMGLGHAVYQTDDPRAIILAPMSQRTGQIANQPLWYELSRELEKKGKDAFKAKKQKQIFCNVDFYSASFFHAIGIAMDLFTPVFAVSRVSGWSAHVIEEQFAMAAPKPTLYRPGAEYIGDYCGPDECLFTDMDER
ncbi:citrate/2-methylcitrate synthase [Desulfobacula toluolica]|uniref:Citrate synthase n=1 Tax=Desulfobacula toluolica (strain DSM 7467 / Tol2) TaxID=651182 RepID=K0N7F6_DESTT|nr:citrate/2-methylcitrate synthase [Desulfobacula toluolica]CCK79894.1 GltA: citrate synthase [Desulfobacula toluolica Tol2]